MPPIEPASPGLFDDHLVIVRGGGDLGSGVIATLRRVGFPVIVLELDRPLVIRRTVAFASAVLDGSAQVEGITATLVETPEEATRVARQGEVAVLAESRFPPFEPAASIVVDARMAKRNIDTSTADAGLVVALGPGFTAGVDCHAVIETARGHRLGRVIWQGAAEPNTGIPGRVGGETARRIVRAPKPGRVEWNVGIGSIVSLGEELGSVGGAVVEARTDGVVRGLIHPGVDVTVDMKIGDIDPRADQAACHEISDKARLIAAGVLEAILVHLGR